MQVAQKRSFYSLSGQPSRTSLRRSRNCFAPGIKDSAVLHILSTGISHIDFFCNIVIRLLQLSLTLYPTMTRQFHTSSAKDARVATMVRATVGPAGLPRLSAALATASIRQCDAIPAFPVLRALPGGVRMVWITCCSMQAASHCLTLAAYMLVGRYLWDPPWTRHAA